MIKKDKSGKHGDQEQEAAALELAEQWEECCYTLAQQLSPLVDDINENDPLASQKKHSLVREIATTLQTNGLIPLLSEGFAMLLESPDPAERQFCEKIIDQLEKLSENIDEEKMVKEEIATLLHIEEEELHVIANKSLELLNAGEADKAIPLLTVIAFLQTQSDQNWFRLGFALYQQEKYDLAYSCVTTAHLLQPNQPEYSLLLACCCKALDEEQLSSEALEAAKKAIATYNLTLSDEWQELLSELQK